MSCPDLKRWAASCKDWVVSITNRWERCPHRDLRTVFNRDEGIAAASIVKQSSCVFAGPRAMSSDCNYLPIFYFSLPPARRLGGGPTGSKFFSKGMSSLLIHLSSRS